ncbi:MAG: hypothetical protein IPP14_00250 [Planctomycetes bacterium]|nr:hypothetical protein [Planctomycetota bacterium]
MKRILLCACACLCLYAAACGDDREPSKPQPVPSKTTETPAPKVSSEDEEAQRIQADVDQRRKAEAGIEAAATPEAAQKARDTYTGTKYATALNVALDRKVQDLDFAQFGAAKTAVLNATTPKAALEASKLYTGKRYAEDLEKATWAHMEELVKKNPALASELPPKPVKPDEPPKSSSDLLADIAACTRESEVRALLAAYTGPLGADEIQLAVQKWRWSGATVVTQLEPFSELVLEILWPKANEIVVFTEQSVVTLDATTGKAIRTAKGGTYRAISRDGRWCLVDAGKGKAVILDLESGSELCVLDTPITSFGDIDVSADGTLAAVGGNSTNLYLFELPTGKLLKSLTENMGAPTTVMISPDATCVVVGDAAGKGRIWNIADGRKVADLAPSKTTATPRGFSSDGKAVYVALQTKSSNPGGSEAHLKLLNLADGSQVSSVALGILNLHDTSVSNDGLLVIDTALVGEDGSMTHLRRLSDGQTLATFDPVKVGNRRAFSPEGNRFVAQEGGPHINIFGRPD